MAHPRLDLSGPLPSGRLVIEASAGTGKTYSLTALVVRNIAERGLASSDLLVVTFTRAAAAELRDRTRSAMVAALAALEAVEVPTAHEWMRPLLEASVDERDLYRDRLSLAISTFDDATITTIHSFCQLALRQLGLRSGTALGGDIGDSTSLIIAEVCRDLVVRTLVHDADAFDVPALPPAAEPTDAPRSRTKKKSSDTPRKAYSPQQAYESLVATVKAVVGNPGATLVPPPTAVDAVADASGDPALSRWVRRVHEAADLVDQRRRERNELGFEDLITGLCDALRSDDSEAVAASLRDRYRLVLVDEFQDTDPVQWEIFETAFHDRLVTVGDPKQAIYRFRGADVTAYLAATEGRPTVQLDTNFRSDRDLVAATNHLLSGFALGHDRIAVEPVSSSPSRPTRAMGETPLTIRRIPDDESLHKSQGFSAPLGRAAIIADLGEQVVTWLEHGSIETADGERRHVRPGDIAVLVASRYQAGEVSEGLASCGVPSVRTRTGSVLATGEANEWDLFLAALERPTHAPTVRAAGLGVFMRTPVEFLDATSDEGADHVAAMQRRAATWADRLASGSFLGWYDLVRAESGVLSRLLAESDGERRLTDLDHIAELLAIDLGDSPVSAAAARRALARLRSMRSDENELSPEMRRIDTDAEAVKILTLHSSKGLEFPIVLVPFAWQADDERTPWLYSVDGVRHVDVASERPWRDADGSMLDDRKALAAKDGFGDRLRLLYVGLTRGMHRTVVWWAPGTDSASSALNTVLFARNADGTPYVPAEGGAPPALLPESAAVDVQLADLATRSGGTVEIETVELSRTARRWVPSIDHGTAPVLSTADAHDRDILYPVFRRWSFSSIHATREHLWSPLDDANIPVVGGADEPESGEREPSAVPNASVTSGIVMPLAGAPGGTAFGTLVHDVFEGADVASGDLVGELGRVVDRVGRRALHGISRGTLVAGLAAAAETPLGDIASGLRLADIAATDRLAEMAFDMPLHDTDVPVDVSAIGDVLLRTLATDDPQRGYAQLLADGHFDLDIAGYLQGSIDALLRIPNGDGTQRHVVVDYKTNRLHATESADPLAAYHPSLLPAEMAHADYVLQALLYSVATHRFLRWRIAGYDPGVHLGGIAYLFVRGMVGPSTPVVSMPDGTACPYGVFAWRPPSAAIVALDDLLAGRGAA